ncbi:hypothetical protein HOLleu_11420 [Holothuria leucospilota]|uniref:Uncharacterized protein n=1 Tax=Holothuria leucospilota TaxID=206669 RepID=A0A9Q1CG48_HOLLE|nr:hypothetical protein HOLleu_11420 [Holothuria leucospilota]
MDGLPSVVQLMRVNCFMASIDLKDAYYSVPIDCDHRKYLRFEWNHNVYEYTCLPNGLASAPRVFTKLLKPVFSNLRKRGFNVVGYIDDIFIKGDTFNDCEQAVKATVNLLTELGFLVHYVKSEPEPNKEIRFLGFMLNSEKMTISPSFEKKEKTKEKSKMLLRASSVKIRNLAEIIGVLVANFPGVEFGPLYYRSLERDKIRALKRAKGDFDSMVCISSESRADLLWWIKTIDTASKLIEHGKPSQTLNCDASNIGWGAVLGYGSRRGVWNSEQRRLHINERELLAIYFGLKTLCSKLGSVHLRILSDSSVAVSYINRMGGTKSPKCNVIAKSIWLWCIQRNIWISAAHISGARNEYADYLSRLKQATTEWSLSKQVFHQIEAMYGSPDVDLFASRFNTKLPTFVSWKPDPIALAIDAFSLDWKNYKFYAFPPFSLVGKCLQKISADNATGILVAPLWTTQPWFVTLLEMLVAQPSIIRLKEDTTALQKQDVSPKAADIILAGWRPSTQKQYFSSLTKWISFCSRRQTNPFHTTIRHVLDFLLELFEAGLGYSSINTAKSMLSTFVSEPKEVGKKFLVKKFMKGVFELRTPRPKYDNIWDVATVLNYIKELGSNESFSLKLLSHKVVMLTVLVSAQRCQTICSLDLDNLDKQSDDFVFYVQDMLKQSRPGKVGLKITFSKFKEDERVCVYSLIEHYIERTKALRNQSKLVISYRKPHAPVGAETISRWIREVLEAAGVNTKMFTAHSTRAAASSAMHDKGVAIQDIMKTAGWSNAETFARFYKKPIIFKKESSCTNALLR